MGSTTRRTTDSATHLAAGQHYAPGTVGSATHMAALRRAVGSCAALIRRVRPDQLLHHHVDGPLGRRTDDADIYQRTSRPCATGAASQLLCARGTDSVSWSLHRQLGPRHPHAPASTCSHSWLRTRQEREERRGLTHDGTGGRRLLQAQPGRAGTWMRAFWKSGVTFVLDL